MADTQARWVWNPQERLVVQLPSSKEHPGGRTVEFTGPGWINLDSEGLLNHPILSGLAGDLPGSADRQERLAQADKEYAEALGEAETRRTQERMKIQQEELDERQGLAQEYSQRKADAAAQGTSFSEMHPDPEARRAHAITSNHTAVASAALLQKPQGIKESQDLADALPSEEDQTQTAKGAKQRQQPVHAEGASQPSRRDEPATTDQTSTEAEGAVEAEGTDGEGNPVAEADTAASGADTHHARVRPRGGNR